MHTKRTRFDGTTVPEPATAAPDAPFRAATLQAVEKLEAFCHDDQTTGLDGLATGLQRLDTNLGGLRGSELIVLAGRPGMGKSALALNVAEHATVALKRAVAFFCPEATKAQLTERLLCCRAKINVEALRHGCVLGQDLQSLGTAAHDIAAAPLHLDDTPGLLIEDLCAKAWKIHHDPATDGLALIVVDCLDLLRADTERARTSRHVELGDIAAGLKALAKELDVPVLAVAHLNRSAESRPDGRPQLSDLRDSGSIEDTADVVLLLHRAKQEGWNGEELGPDAELLIAKHRNGSTARVHLTFHKQFCRFEDPA